MTNILENGLKWLSGKQKKHVSSKVLYRRGDLSYEVDAVLGRTTFEIADEYGLKIQAHSIDFIINAAELDLLPKVGDRIVYREIVHEVLELGGGECWRWCDPYRIIRRIHTKQI